MPSAPPTVVMGKSTKDSVSVFWNPIDCNKTNGDINGYRLMIKSSYAYESYQVHNSNIMNYTITQLNPSTQYIIKVAAQNFVGTGEYSHPITVKTKGKYL